MTKSGGKFVIINLYQFTAANPAEQKEVWDIIAAWVQKHPNDQTILLSDYSSAPAGERTGYSLLWERIGPLCQIGFSPVRNYRAR